MRPSPPQPPQTKPPQRSPAGSLGRRLVLATLIFCLVFTLLAVVVRTGLAWNSNLAAMTSELRLIDQVFQRSLSKAIWEMDREALQTQLDSVAQAVQVGRVQLSIHQAGRAPEVWDQQSTGHSTSQWAPTLQHTLTYEPYAGAHEAVGELLIEGDERLLWQRLLSDVTSIVISQIIHSLLLAGLIMWLFNRLVTVHVQHIARHLGQLSPTTLKRLLRLDRTINRHDELSLLETGVNDLQGTLSAYLDRQHQAEQDLAAHRDRLAELVDERTLELRAANARLEQLSRCDPLTGLANRRHFDELKDVEFCRAQRLGQPLSVLMCDVDFFKPYNDSYGHALGDQCLQGLAELLRRTFARAGELVARIGGEEFVVLLPGCDAVNACRAAQRLRAELASLAIEHRTSPVAPCVTLSIGVAQFDPANMHSFDLLMQRADQALYRAKHLGRDQVVH